METYRKSPLHFGQSEMKRGSGPERGMQAAGFVNFIRCVYYFKMELPIHTLKCYLLSVVFASLLKWPRPIYLNI